MITAQELYRSALFVGELRMGAVAETRTRTGHLPTGSSHRLQRDLPGDATQTHQDFKVFQQLEFCHQPGLAGEFFLRSGLVLRRRAMDGLDQADAA